MLRIEGSIGPTQDDEQAGDADATQSTQSSSSNEVRKTIRQEHDASASTLHFADNPAHLRIQPSGFDSPSTHAPASGRSALTGSTPTRHGKLRQTATDAPAENRTFTDSQLSVNEPGFISSQQLPGEFRTDSQRISAFFQSLGTGKKTLMLEALFERLKSKVTAPQGSRSELLFTRLANLPASDGADLFRSIMAERRKATMTPVQKQNLDGLQREVSQGTQGPYVNSFIDAVELLKARELSDPHSRESQMLAELRQLAPPAAPQWSPSLSELVRSPITSLALLIKSLVLQRPVTTQEADDLRRYTLPADAVMWTGAVVVSPAIAAVPLTGLVADIITKATRNEPVSNDEIRDLFSEAAGVGMNVKLNKSRRESIERSRANDPATIALRLENEALAKSDESSTVAPDAPFSERLRGILGNNKPAAVPRGEIALGNGRYVDENGSSYIRDGSVYHPLDWDATIKGYRLRSASAAAGVPIRLGQEGWDVDPLPGSLAAWATRPEHEPVPAGQVAVRAAQLANADRRSAQDFAADGAGVFTDGQRNKFAKVDNEFHPIELDASNGTFTVTASNGHPLPIKFAGGHWVENPAFERASMTGGAVEETIRSGRLVNTPDGQLPDAHWGVAQDLLTMLALDPANPVTAQRAYRFRSELGFARGDAPMLIAQIREKVARSEAIAGLADDLGWRFSTTLPILGRNGRVRPVTVCWIYRPGSAHPALISAYVAA